MQPKTNDELLTASQLAKRIGRSHVGVKNALQRLEIRPAGFSGRMKLYKSSVLPTLEKGMRAANQAA